MPPVKAYPTTIGRLRRRSDGAHDFGFICGKCHG